MGDVPDRLKRRYYTEQRVREWRFYLDAQVATPVFLDRGRRLVAPRADPNAVRDMVAVAQHRGWSLVVAKGSPGFRREAWLAGRTAGLEVRGHTPTQRDLQELERRRENHQRLAERLRDLERGVTERRATDARRPQPMSTVAAVVKSRIVEPAEQERVLRRARDRLADWLERGGPSERPRDRPGHSREHTRSH